jgi:predicted transcriptional regulator
MEENDCGLIPVVESLTSKKPIGTVTDRDIALRAVARGGDGSLKASDIMTAQVATVRPETSIEQCFDVMEDNEIRRVLVVDGDGKLCGIVAQADIVQADTNPMRTNKVIREISESAPSHQDADTMQSVSSGFSSLFSGRNLYPFVVGLGSGVGLAYLLSNWTGGYEDRYSDMGGYRSRGRDVNDIVDEANSESFGKYADAEREVANRRQHLEGRFNSLRSEPGSPLTGRSEHKTGTDDATDRTRTAGQNG